LIYIAQRVNKIMIILGLTAPISENTSACIINNGDLVAFAEEERFNGIKHAARMVPVKSIKYCLDSASLTIDDVDYIAIGFDRPVIAGMKNFFTNLKEANFSRLVRESGAYVEYLTAMQRQIDFLSSLSSTGNVRSKLAYVNHHLSHASSAVRVSGYSDSVVITLDGVGEDNAGMVGYYEAGEIKRLRNIPINQSLGWLYGDITSLCGFKSHSHEGKTMGLAAYGTPNLSLFDGIAELTDDGYKLDRKFASKLRERFRRRKPDEEITDYHKNLAATVQMFLEEAVLRIAKSVSSRCNSRNLALAGGVALNCDMNYRLSNSGCFDNIFVQPAANDAGTALGAAMEVAYARGKTNNFVLRHAYYGPSYSDDEIEELLKESKIPYRRVGSLAEVAQMINEGKIVGWFSGRMEFGPRALGGRSILANPQIEEMREKINLECKHRENWRPFAPSVLSEHCDEYFENYHHSPFMLMTFKAKQDKKHLLAATIHVDDTARVQEVNKKDSPRYYELINEFYKLSGVAAVLDTSLNDKEKPICLSPREAVQTFYTTGLDVMVIENFILEK